MILILNHLTWELLFSALVAMFIGRISIPPIVRVSRIKGLVAVPNGRTSHSGSVPYLGGVSIFASLVISASLFVRDGYNEEFQFIIPALLIIFFIGIKDDVVSINPRTKLAAQIIASLIVIIFANVRILTFHGLFGIWELTDGVSYSFTLIVFVGLINAFNLIDGIDGLASGLGIQISLVFGFWLAFLQHYDYSVLAFALAGGLIPFYVFNVFGKKYKLFMGDTGSLLIGFVFAILSVNVMCCKLPAESLLYAEGLPILILSVMIIPIADTIRLFVFRSLHGRSPLRADKHHFHHHLLRIGMNHWQASTTIIAINFLLFVLAFTLRHWNDGELALLMFSLAFLITAAPGILMWIKAGGKSVVMT